ncbi:MAG: phosphoribosylformylglycinamidine synthase subunit PurQ, partial [Robiginitalea sp.]
AGSFKFNEKARNALKNFYAREDSLSLGVCNGCQLMMELDLIYPEMQDHPKMHHNNGGKFECGFVNVEIPENNSVLLKSLKNTRLGIWLAHGEGRFNLENEDSFNSPMKYAYEQMPGNANGSSFSIAALCSNDGRHLAMMPHLERSLFPFNWAHNKGTDGWDVSPWMIPFVEAKKWISERV